MRIYHHTSPATLVQLIVGSALTFITGFSSIISGCYGNGSTDCVSNTFVSLLLVLLVISGYGLLAGVGYIAQARRSGRLALVLIGMEACAGVIFLFDAKQSLDLVDRAANLAAFALAVWVAYVAFNLFRSRGTRVVRKSPKHMA